MGHKLRGLGPTDSNQKKKKKKRNPNSPKFSPTVTSLTLRLWRLSLPPPSLYSRRGLCRALPLFPAPSSQHHSSLSLIENAVAVASSLPFVLAPSSLARVAHSNPAPSLPQSSSGRTPSPSCCPPALLTWLSWSSRRCFPLISHLFTRDTII